MKEFGLLINYEWCSGCQSCEIACRNEHGWDLDKYGVKVLELGPFMIDEKEKPSQIDWHHTPALTTLCDLCDSRVKGGGVPACQLHCLAGVIEYGSVQELAEKAILANGKTSLIVP